MCLFFICCQFNFCYFLNFCIDVWMIMYIYSVFDEWKFYQWMEVLIFGFELGEMIFSVGKNK